MRPTIGQAKRFLAHIPKAKRRPAYAWAVESGFFRPRHPFHSLTSPQGHVQYNARFVVGNAVDGMEPDRWYTNAEIAALADGQPFFLRESPHAAEKGVKKWRYDRETSGHPREEPVITPAEENDR